MVRAPRNKAFPSNPQPPVKRKNIRLKRIDVLQQKITKLQRLLAAEKEQPDDPAEVPRIEAELIKAHAEMSSLKSD